AYRACADLPLPLCTALQQFVSACGDHFAQNPALVDVPLQLLYFDAGFFSRLAELFGPHSLFDISKREGARSDNSTLCIRNVVPAPFLAPRFAHAHTATLFSATLQPQQFYRDLLGLPANTAWIDVPSPFVAAQLDVVFAQHISTRFERRAASLAPIADLIAQQFA